MERVLYNGTIKPNLATNSAARSFIVSVDPNSNNAVSWDRGYHFNNVSAVAPVHSNGLTSAKEEFSNAEYSGITNSYGWTATHNNTWTLNELANAQIDPYTYFGNLYDPVKTVYLIIEPGTGTNTQVYSPGYAGASSSSWEYFLQPAGNPGAPWARKAFTTLPYYISSLLNPSSSNLYYFNVSPSVPRSGNLYMDTLSFPSSITSNLAATRTVSGYNVAPAASGYTVSTVTLSPFRMTLAVINNQGNWAYCYIPLHVATHHMYKTFTFEKNPNNSNKFELKAYVSCEAYLDRECLRVCQNYLKAGISAGSFNGSTKSYFPMLDWEPQWRFSSLPGSGISEAPLGSARFRVNWSVYNSNRYHVSNIEQIQ